MPIQREIVGPQHGGTITSHAAGITQGTLEFAVGQAHDIQSMFARMGAGQMEFDVEETTQILQTIEQSQYDQIAYLEDMTLNAFSVDRTDDTYQSYRSGTSTCLAVGSLAVGGYGVAKAGYQIIKIKRAGRFASELIGTVGKSEDLINRAASFAGSKKLPLKYAGFQEIRNEAKVVNGRKYCCPFI